VTTRSDGYVLENEAAFSLSPGDAGALLTVVRNLADAPPYRGQAGRTATSAALHLCLEDLVPRIRRRLVIRRGKKSGRIRATYEPKRLVTTEDRMVKHELRESPVMDVDACAAFLRREGRAIDAAFLKSKATATYEGIGKLRIDRVLPLAPNDPGMTAAPFWDFELELEEPDHDPEEEAVALVAHHGLGFPLSPLQETKCSRARLFPPAAATVWAERLEELTGLGFGHHHDLLAADPAAPIATAGERA
jgi:hypothetical protein